jgi:hypothetical protein
MIAGSAEPWRACGNTYGVTGKTFKTSQENAGGRQLEAASVPWGACLRSSRPRGALPRISTRLDDLVDGVTQRSQDRVLRLNVSATGDGIKLIVSQDRHVTIAVRRAMMSIFVGLLTLTRAYLTTASTPAWTQLR